MIERTRHVRRARLRQDGEKAVEEAQGGADLAADWSLFGRRAEEAAEELISAVYQVDPHLCSSVGRHPQANEAHSRLTPGVSRDWKRERSGHCKASPAHP